MARTMQTTAGIFLGFLSTALFIATFIIVGDVLIAATVAMATAVAQFVLRQSAHHKVGVLIWASLALVIGLTSLTLIGDDADAAYAPIGLSQSDYVTPNCHCHGPLQIDASAPALTNL